MEILRQDTIMTLANSGVRSEQLLCPENSDSRRVTVTRVTVQRGAVNPSHRHDKSEQIWVALEGRGTLLLEGGSTALFAAGDVVRFSDGELHGLRNTGEGPFVYLSVTSPPINFRDIYAGDWSKAATP